MRPLFSASQKLLALVFFISMVVPAKAQAPPSIQFFMPDGSLPSREIRFTMAVDNGRIEEYFSDSKGRFLMTRQFGIRADAELRITVQSDGRTYDTTVVSIKEFSGVYYIPVFLRPLRSPAVPRANVIDLAEFDTLAPEPARDAYESAMRAMRAGQTEEAARELEHALSIYPNYFRALNDLGVIYMNLNRLDESAQLFERAAKVAPRVYYPRLNLAIVRTRQGKHKEAAEILQHLEKENPSLAEVKVALGDALLAMDKLDEAEGHLRTAIDDLKLSRESQADARYKLGLVLNKKQKYDEAVKQLSLASEVLPNSARIHLQLGGALLQVKKLDDAERELLAAYRIGGPSLGGAQLMLGQIYFIEKKYEAAMRAFEQYLTDVPQAPNAKEVRAFIEKIRNALDQK
ncbi:MAG TPA: tetratricopeptide repeat protein [Blastocatellia bacterium]|nr:tetratricopeptide repeat protein [Blastocatellia bacterium]